MADFASAYANFNKPSVQLENPMDAYGRAQQLQNLNTQGQLLQGQVQTQQMQQTSMERQIQDAQDVRDAIKSANGDPNAAMANVSKLGSTTGLEYLAKMKEMQLKGVQLSSAQNDLATKHLAMVGNGIGAAQTPEQAANIVKGHALIGNIPQPDAQGLLAGIPQNPDEFKTWQKLQAAKLGASKEVMDMITPAVHQVDTGTATQFVGVTPSTGTVAPIGAPIDKDIQPGDLKKFASDIGAIKDDGSVDLNNPQVQAKIHAMTTNMATVIQGGAAGGGASFDPSQPLSPADESQARYAAQTGARETPSMRNPGALQRNARAEYLAQQGGGDIAQNKIQFKTQQDAQKYFTTGGGADAFRQQETILHHAQVFGQIYDALNNGNTQLANKLGNEFGVQFGSDQATNAKIVGQVMSAEVGKYLAGNQGSKEERAELAGLIPTFSSPAQAKGGLQTLQTLVQGQRASWTAQRDAALKGQVAFGPGLQKVSPQDAAKLPAGTHFLGLDGLERVKH